MKRRLTEHAADAAYLVIGVLICGFALKGFILPNGLLDGGTSGVTLTIHAFVPIDVGYLVLPLNLPFILLGARMVDLAFALKTLACIVGLSLCLLLVPFHVMTSDRFLTAVCGGAFMGGGVGLAMRGGAALDGFDVLALCSVKRLPFTSAEVILTINVAIFLVAAAGFGIEVALYSILTYFVNIKVSDFVVTGIEEYTSVTITSAKTEAIRRALVLELGRGVTVFKGERGYLPGSFEIKAATDILFAVVTRLEVKRITNMVHRIDPHAFVVTASANDASGGILRRRAGV